LRIACVATFVLAISLVCGSQGIAQTSASAARRVAQTACCTATSPAPTASAAPVTVYKYDGIQIYNGTAGVPDPVANADLTNASVDPNSASITSALNSSFSFINSSEAQNERVNVVGPSPMPTLYPIAVATNGHNPPIYNGSYGGGSGAKAPWIPGQFVIQGNCTLNCTQDNHVMILNTATHIVIQGSGWNWNGTILSAYDGNFDSMDASYCSQISGRGDDFSVSGVPGPGFTDFGEDLLAAKNNGTPILHPIALIVPIEAVASGTPGVNYSTLSTNNVGSCAGNPYTQCLQFGDLLRLKPGVTCPGDAVAAAVCVQLKRQTGVVADLGELNTPRFGLDLSGTDDTDSALFTWLHSLSLTNFDVILRNSVHC
jgi:hypothetical protein